MLEQRTVVEHGTSRAGRWLRERRLKTAFWIAVIEGLLIVVHAIPWQVAIIVAVAVIAIHFWAGNRLGSDAARQVSWIAAVSQALVALIPVLVILVGTLALIAVAAIAVVALILLLSDRG
jgi:hypothetical protein